MKVSLVAEPATPTVMTLTVIVGEDGGIPPTPSEIADWLAVRHADETMVPAILAVPKVDLIAGLRSGKVTVL